jgi:hypothetical protein
MAASTAKAGVGGADGPPKPVTDERARGTALADIPALAWLLEQKRFCVWDWQLKGRKDQPKWTKPPRIPGTPIGQRVNDPSTCVSYEVARGAVLAGDGEGVGWVLLDELNVVWLDADKCRDPVTGELAPWAQALLEMAGGAYHELTPSGTGLRIAGGAGMFLAFQGRLDMRAFLGGLDEADLARWGGSRDCAEGAAVEIFYGCARYVTMTGWQAAGSIDADIGRLAIALWEAGDAQGIVTRSVRAAGLARAEVTADRTGPIEDIVSALGVMENDELHWDDWNTIGLAAHAASGGDADAFEAFRAWSEQSAKHDDVYCAEQWEKWGRSPATRSGIGTLTWHAQQADPGWIRPSKRGGLEFDLVEVEEGEPGKPCKADAAGGAAAFADLVARFRYVRSPRGWLDRDGVLLDDQQLAAEAGGMGVAGFMGRGAKGLTARMLHPRSRLRRCVGLTMRPGQGEVVHEPWGPCANLWRPSDLAPRAGATEADAAPWLEHARRLIPNDADRERVLDRFAWILQNPGRKINSALVLLGPQGAGKDTLLLPVLEAIGQHNVGEVSGSNIGGSFNGYLRNQMLLINEMPPAHKRDSYESIKGWMTTPPGRVPINLKGVEAFSVPNVINAAITSNHIGAIALAEDDRRFDIVATIIAALSGDPYWARLHRWLDGGGHAIVAGYLMARDVSAFNASAAPPMTEAKRTMMREGAHPAVAWVMSLFDEGRPLAERDVVTVGEIVGKGQAGKWEASGGVSHSLTWAHVLQGLRQHGWRVLPQQIVDGEDKPRPWARAGSVTLLSQLTATALREHLQKDRGKNSGFDFG